MISFNQYTLANGLRLIHHRDRNTCMVAVNLLYNVGSSDEDPAKTGLAHLMEHLMFSGSANASSYDECMQQAGGDSNAWTNLDCTNYYEILPADNIKTALWLESDRMTSLSLSDHNIAVQKGVVIEEFKQRYLNQPYGDILHLTQSLAYTRHPYRWPTIGLDVATIGQFTRDDILSFYHRFYSVNNAVLCISGNIGFDEAVRLTEKWFGDIKPVGNPYQRNLPQEPEQTSARFLRHECDVPANMIIKAYHMCRRTDPQFAATDILSDVLGNGQSSRFYKELILEKNLFADIDASVMGTRDNGLFLIRGRLNNGIPFEQGDEAICNVLTQLLSDGCTAREVEKCVNKFISNRTLEELGYAAKAVALCKHEILWGADRINEEDNAYFALTPADVLNVAQSVLRPENSSTIHYGNLV